MEKYLEGQRSVEKRPCEKNRRWFYNNIFKSPWIKSVENFTIRYSNQSLNVNATVDELILPEIKTAYKAAHQSYSSSNRWVAYKGVWNMNVPPKIRNFIWRAYRNILPTCIVLRNRGIDIDNKCCMCNSEEETIRHALYGCSVLQDFWRNRGLRFEDVGGNGISFIDWFQGQLRSLNNREVETYCILASKIWQRRNFVVHGSAPYSLSRIWDDKQRMIETLKEGDEAIPIILNRTDSPTTGWQAPSSWFVFKLNVDASLRLNERGRIGCVIRDNNGRCIATMTKKIQGVVDVVQLEALAVYEGMCLAKSLMCTDIQVEGDAKQVMDLLKGGGLNRSYLGQIIEDILALKLNFKSVSFNWVARSPNLVAHTLAFSDFSFPINSLDSYVWLEDFPSIICNALRSDIS
ncbi:putative ribonuclease H protein [Senna tora]|uniref:Putative ribonuclease H protein n=1 Tax=Senna tora TaxID=362788 RepID=A0A834SVX0_9FABA|nr:putative ribonuclease H protein [Senna tora]